MEKQCSVYELEFPNGKKYIGISTKPDKRWKDHCYSAFNLSRKSPLYCAMRFFGKEAVKRKTLLISTLSYARETEQKIIAAWETQAPNGYNLLPGGEYSPFSLFPDLAKAHGETIKGFKHSEETKEKIRSSLLGVKKSSEHVKNMTAARTGKPNGTKGRKDSDEVRAIKSEAAKKRGLSPEFISKNPMLNSEYVKKLAASLKGKPLSEKHKQSLKNAWIARKEKAKK